MLVAILMVSTIAGFANNKTSFSTVTGAKNISNLLASSTSNGYIKSSALSILNYGSNHTGLAKQPVTVTVTVSIGIISVSVTFCVRNCK